MEIKTLIHELFGEVDYLTDEQIREIMKNLSERDGQSFWADRLDISRGYWNDIVTGDSKPGPKIAEAFGLKRQRVYFTVQN